MGLTSSLEAIKKLRTWAQLAPDPVEMATMSPERQTVYLLNLDAQQALLEPQIEQHSKGNITVDTTDSRLARIWPGGYELSHRIDSKDSLEIRRQTEQSIRVHHFSVEFAGTNFECEIVDDPVSVRLLYSQTHAQIVRLMDRFVNRKRQNLDPEGIDRTRGYTVLVSFDQGSRQFGLIDEFAYDRSTCRVDTNRELHDYQVGADLTECFANWGEFVYPNLVASV